jgi:hypothetical protein
MCARDFFFYINTFAWTYDPKNYPDNPVRPMNSWDFQDDFLWEVIQSIGHHDIVIKKSRDMAATTGIITAYQWRWNFHPGQQFIAVSRNEKYVDKPRDPKCLFWKIDFILENLPKWLVPNYDRTYLNIYNNDNRSSINGESTTGDIGRGSKPTSIMIDEYQAFERQAGYSVLAATRDSTRNRIFNFTSGASGMPPTMYLKIPHSNKSVCIGRCIPTRTRDCILPRTATCLFWIQSIHSPSITRLSPMASSGVCGTTINVGGPVACVKSQRNWIWTIRHRLIRSTI